MVFHAADIAFIVVQHRAVRTHQSDAVRIDAADAAELLPVVILNRGGDIAAFVCQTAAHIMRQTGMHRNQQQRSGEQQGDQRGEENTAEYALSHS